MKYYIVNPENKLFTFLEVTHSFEINIYKENYSTYNFILVDQSLHGKKLVTDPFYKRNYLVQLKGE